MGANRRRFLNILLGGGLAGFLGSIFYPVLSFLNPPRAREPGVSSIKAGSAFAFPPDSGRIVKFGRKPVIVVRTDTGDFRAFSAVCTHLDCIVQYRKDFKHIWCACHNGHYDLRGRNISGPPPRPLDEFTVAIVDDEIVVSRAG